MNSEKNCFSSKTQIFHQPNDISYKTVRDKLLTLNINVFFIVSFIESRHGLLDSELQVAYVLLAEKIIEQKKFKADKSRAIQHPN